MITRGWFLAALLSLVLIGAAHAQLTNEIALSQPVHGPAPGDQTGSAVATDGLDFLVAWIDLRSPSPAICANRVTRDGTVLDGTGIRLRVDPAVFNGQLTGVFYVDGAYTIIYSYQSFSNLYRTTAAVVGTDGSIIEEPRTIREDPFVPIGAGATNGSRIVLLAASETFVVNGRGDVIDRFPMSTGKAYGLNIAWNGSTFLAGMLAYDAATNASHELDLVALDASGKPGNVTRIAASALAGGPVIGSDGSDYLVVYIDGTTGRATALSVDAHAVIRSTQAFPGIQYPAGPHSLIWTDRSYIAATTTLNASQEISALVLDRSGTPLRGPRKLGADAPGTVNQVATAWNGTTALLVWTFGSQSAASALDVVGAVTNSDATAASAPFTISISSNMQVGPAIATSGLQDLAVWAEPTGIYATRVRPDGRTLDGRGFVISNTIFPSRSLAFSVVTPTIRAIYDGSAYLVAWSDNTGVTAQRVDPASGSLVGPAMPLGQCARSFDLAADNESPVLFCSDWRVFAQRIGATGLVGDRVAISPVDMLADQPHAAWNGSQWLVVWTKLIQSGLLISPPIYVSSGAYAARVSAALTLVDVQPILVSAVVDAQDGAPLVASDGREFVVAWSHRTLEGPYEVYVRRVQADGSKGDAQLLSSGSLFPRSMVWDGTRYAIAYTSNESSSNSDLFLTHVPARASDPLPHDFVAISATLSDERFVALVAPRGRPVRIVYSRVAAEPEYGNVSRVFMVDEFDSTRRRAVRPR